MDKEKLINGYFESTLSQDQLEEVTRLRETDTEFATDFEFQKDIQVSLRKEERQKIKAMFSDSNAKKAKPEIKVFKLRPWLSAASIALLVGIGSWLFYFSTATINTAELYATNFAPYDNVIHPIERGNQLEDLKTKAFTAYENEEYPKALELFDALNTKHNDSYIDFYTAMVLMQLNKQEEAIPLLEGYVEKNGELVDRAHWYLALAYLKVEDIASSKKQLNLLVKKEGFKTQNAKELLDKLD